MGRKIKIGYLKYKPEPDFISARVIENSFLSFLGQYANISIITVSNDRYIKEAFKRIERYNPDYLYISSFRFMPTPFLLREKLRMDIPFIFYIHAFFPCFSDFVYIIPFLRKNDKILAPSKYAKNLFLKLSSKFDIHVVPYSIDLNLIQKNLSHKLKKNKKIITFMGRLTEKKGIGVLIESLSKAIPKIKNVHLNIIGPLSGVRIRNSPKSTYVKKIEKLIKKHKLVSRVTFKGVQLGSNKYKILSESDVLVNPTLAEEETFGIVNIEALACGVPVITTDWAGGREIVENDKNGYLLEIRRDKNNKPYFACNQLLSLIIKVLGGKNPSLRLRKNAMMSAGKYDYHIVMPHLVSLLRKRKVNLVITKGWDFFKDKTLSDFGYIFNKELLFFLSCERDFRTWTFSMLYNSIINDYVDRSIPPKKSGEDNTRKKSYKSSIFKKIRSDFYYFLTST